MRILLSSHGASPYGAERVLLVLAEGLAARGHAVTLELPHAGPALDSARTLDGVEIRVSHRPRLPRNVGEVLRWIAGAPTAVARFRRLVRDGGYDVVWVNSLFNPLAALAARLAGARVVWHLHERNFRGPGALLGGLAVRTLCHTPVAVSAFVASTFRGVAPGRFRTLRNAAFRRFPAQPPRSGDGAFSVGYLGQIEPRKRVGDLLRAAALVPDAHVLVVGDGKERGALAAAAAPLGGRVEWAGFQPDVLPWLARMDCVVIPSRDEPCPLTAFEAMAAGRPVIASDHGAHREVLGDAALFFPLGDTAELAACIRRLRDEPTLADALRQRGLERARDADAGAWLQRAEAIATESAAAPAWLRAPDPGRRRRFSGVLALAAIAVALRLLMFTGRGDYVAFDEGWYLLLGRNLWAGRGYTLSGMQHVALSPLFPILAGGLARLTGRAVWAGRIVAATASGLLVLPCWAVFRRLAGRRTALYGCALVAVLPSMTPFVAPYWVGWDLWVGAGPLFYLFLFTGLAFVLRALERRSAGDDALAGLAFGLAFLARPEAILAFGLVGMAVLGFAAARRSPRLLAACLVAALAFALPTAPYFLYLRDTLGHWAVTGRGVALTVPSLDRDAGRPGASFPSTATAGVDPAGKQRSTLERGSAGSIEGMLWEGNDTSYARALYALAPSGTRMANGYWGVPLRTAAGRVGRLTGAHAGSLEAGTAAPVASGRRAPGRAARTDGSVPEPRAGGPAARAWLYLRALGVVVPWFLWPFVIAGVLVPGRRRRNELVVFAPLAVTGVAIAALVAVDPRTQLFLAPVLAFYAARGLRLGAMLVERRARGADMGRAFPRRLAVAVMLLILLGVDARRLYLSATVGSVDQVVGAANREVGAALRAMVPPDQPVMSWSPAPAVWADRDWRVLPTASLPRVMRYAGAIDERWAVFSTVNPSPLPRAQMPRAFLLLRLEPGSADARAWRVEISRIQGQYAIGTLGPAAAEGPPAVSAERSQ